LRKCFDMEKDVVIKVEGLNKKFCRSLKRSLLYGALDIARDMFGITRDRGKLRKDEFSASSDKMVPAKRRFFVSSTEFSRRTKAKFPFEEGWARSLRSAPVFTRI